MKAHRFISPLTRFAYAYPVLMLASLYTTWFAAWAVLGHPPRPSLDDPKYISTLVDIPYVLTMLLIIAMPGAMVLGAGLTPLHLRRYTSSKGALLAKTGLALVILAALWAAAKEAKRDCGKRAVARVHSLISSVNDLGLILTPMRLAGLGVRCLVFDVETGNSLQEPF